MAWRRGSCARLTGRFPRRCDASPARERFDHHLATRGGGAAAAYRFSPGAGFGGASRAADAGPPPARHASPGNDAVGPGPAHQSTARNGDGWQKKRGRRCVAGPLAALPPPLGSPRGARRGASDSLRQRRSPRPVEWTLRTARPDEHARPPSNDVAWSWGKALRREIENPLLCGRRFSRPGCRSSPPRLVSRSMSRHWHLSRRRSAPLVLSVCNVFIGCASSSRNFGSRARISLRARSGSGNARSLPSRAPGAGRSQPDSSTATPPFLRAPDASCSWNVIGSRVARLFSTLAA